MTFSISPKSISRIPRDKGKTKGYCSESISLLRRVGNFRRPSLVKLSVHIATHISMFHWADRNCNGSESREKKRGEGILKLDREKEREKERVRRGFSSKMMGSNIALGFEGTAVSRTYKETTFTLYFLYYRSPRLCVCATWCE